MFDMRKLKSRKHSSSPGLQSVSRRQSSVDGSEIFFSCLASSISRTAESRKHVFTSEQAEKLMHKHLKKKLTPINIQCLEEGVRFKPLSDKLASRRKFATYADIKHVFIFSLNPNLFMICVEDTAEKNKKYYESFQGETAADVGRICQLISFAKNTPDSKLIDPPEMDATELAGDMTTETPGLQQEKRSISLLTSPSLLKAFEKHSLTKDRSCQAYIKEQLSTTVDVQNTELVSAKALNPVFRSPDSSKQKMSNKPLKEPIEFGRRSKSMQNLYIDYSAKHDDPIDSCALSPANLRSTYGRELTFVGTDRYGSSENSRGPVYLFSKHVINGVEPYIATDIESATNSPNFKRHG